MLMSGRVFQALHRKPVNLRIHNGPVTATSSFLKRLYRGDSSEMQTRVEVLSHKSEVHTDVVLLREEELLKVAKPKYDAIYSNHIKMPKINSISNDALGITRNCGSDAEKKELELDVRKKRLIYRSKQRGWLEVDLLLGTWASEHVHTLSSEELDEFERFVNMETIDIYNVLTLRADVPAEFVDSEGTKSNKNNVVGVVARIQEWAKSNPLGKADPLKYATVKLDNNLI